MAIFDYDAPAEFSMPKREDGAPGGWESSGVLEQMFGGSDESR
jgi:hypothetical protein